jgi:single-strand DNA-binding protein
LIGYLGQDPVVKKASNGSPFTRIRMATDYYRRTSDGTVVRKTSWHDVIAWDQLAEAAPNNFIKGSHILVQGNLSQRSYIDKAGNKRYETCIRATELLNLDRKPPSYEIQLRNGAKGFGLGIQFRLIDRA